MADNSVFITGAAEGAFEKAFEGCPAWATEETAGEIEDLLRSLLNVQTTTLTQIVKTAKAGGSGITPEDMEKFGDELNKLSKETDDAVKNEKKANELRKKFYKEEKDRYGRTAREREQQRLTAEVFAKIVAVGKGVWEVQKQYVDTAEALHASGINLLDGQKDGQTAMTSLNQMVIGTGLKLEVLQKIAEKYSQSINAVGMSKYTKAVGLATNRMVELGFKSEDTADFIGSLTESESYYSDQRHKSAEQIADDAVRLGRDYTRLSMAMGVSREQLLQNTKSLSENSNSAVVSAVYGERAAQNMNKFAAGLDPKLGAMMQQFASTDIPFITGQFKSMQQAGQGALAQEFVRIAQYARDTGDALGAQRQLASLSANVNSAELDQLQRLAVAHVEGAQEALDAITAYRAAGSRMSKATDKQVDEAVKSQSAIAGLRTEAASFAASLEKAFPPLISDVENLAKTIHAANQAINATINSMDGETRSTIALVIMGFSAAATAALAFAAYKDKFTDWNFAFGKNKGGGATGGANVPSTSGTGGPRQRSGYQGGRGNAPAATQNQGPSFLSKLGKGFADLGKGIGSGLGGIVEGLFKGIAGGLKELSNPRLLIGVGVLTAMAVPIWALGKALKEFQKLDLPTLGLAAAAIVGVGVAAAAAGAGPVPVMIGLGALALTAMGVALYAIGKGIQQVGPGLTTLAKGLNDLGSVDGKNLGQVALGMTALNAAMIAFTAGSMVSSAGNVLSSLGDRFSKFIGDGSIIDKLKAFVALGPNLGQGANGLVTLTSSVSILSDSLNKLSGIDRLKAVVDTINDLNVLKATALGKLGWSANSVSSIIPTSIQPSSTVSKSPMASTINSPSAVAANPLRTASDTSGQTNSPSAAAVGSGIEKPAKNADINSIMSYQGSLLEQILLSTNNLVSVNKDILKYARVHS